MPGWVEAVLASGIGGEGGYTFLRQVRNVQYENDKYSTYPPKRRIHAILLGTSQIILHSATTPSIAYSLFDTSTQYYFYRQIQKCPHSLSTKPSKEFL